MGMGEKLDGNNSHSLIMLSSILSLHDVLSLFSKFYSLDSLPFILHINVKHLFNFGGEMLKKTVFAY